MMFCFNLIYKLDSYVFSTSMAPFLLDTELPFKFSALLW